MNSRSGAKSSQPPGGLSLSVFLCLRHHKPVCGYPSYPPCDPLACDVELFDGYQVRRTNERLVLVRKEDRRIERLQLADTDPPQTARARCMVNVWCALGAPCRSRRRIFCSRPTSDAPPSCSTKSPSRKQCDLCSVPRLIAAVRWLSGSPASWREEASAAFRVSPEPELRSASGPAQSIRQLIYARQISSEREAETDGGRCAGIGKAKGCLDDQAVV